MTTAKKAAIIPALMILSVLGGYLLGKPSEEKAITQCRQIIENRNQDLQEATQKVAEIKDLFQ